MGFMEVQMNTIEFDTLMETGFIPGIFIVGGWLYALILSVVCLYYFALYIRKLLTTRKGKGV
tara:strand:- start:65 stop:250 length:186 start_codon:yes stop_codon:yes gene_type:complete